MNLRKRLRDGKLVIMNLRVKCENKEHGCQEIIRLDARADHSVNCEFNPKRPIRCEQCCLTIPKNELDNHNCIRDLRKQSKSSFLIVQF